MRGRGVDPELARVVEQRLERLLAERAPRRALDETDPVKAGGDRSQPADDDGWSLQESDADLDTGLDSGRGSGRESAQKPGRGAAVAGEGTGREAALPVFSRAHLVVVGVLVVLGLLLGGWAVLRARPVPLPAVAVTGQASESAKPVPASSDAVSPGSDARASSPPPPGGSRSGGPAAPAVVVHVLGAVRRPGLVELRAGARVQDAIEAAGGLRPGARLGDLNLAQPLTDGQQLLVGRESGARSEVRGGPGSATGSSSPSGSSGAGPGGSLLDLNSSTVDQLDTLPGIGPVTAAKIIAWRTEHGRFSRVEELQEVSGIGPKTYAEVAPLCKV